MMRDEEAAMQSAMEIEPEKFRPQIFRVRGGGKN